MLLSLALLAALPAMGEEIEIVPDDAELSSPEPDSLSIDALPALSGEADLALNDALDLSLVEEEPDGSEENTSKPVPRYHGTNHKLTLNKDKRLTVNVGDTLALTIPGKGAKWFISSNNKVACISDASVRTYLSVIFPNPGKATLTIVQVDGARHTLALTVKDPTLTVKELVLPQEKMTLRVGQDIDLKQLLVVLPDYAKPTYTYRTTDKSVARVSKDGLVTALKAGKATITIAAQNGVKTKLSVLVNSNHTDNLRDKPTARDIDRLSKQWTLWPKSLNLKGNGRVVCKLWLLNGSKDKLTALRNLDLAISSKDSTGNTLIARSAFKKVSVSCPANQWQVVTLTFPVKSVYSPCPDFTGLKAKDLEFKLYGLPRAASGRKSAAEYRATDLSSDGSDPLVNPVKYRALLISESDFYWASVKNPAERWEHSKRNQGVVEKMKTMLQNVKTPTDSKYQITTRNNTSLNELKQLVRKTFAGADENDVSLFFIATHGDSDDDVSDEEAGALVMASQGEKQPEDLRLSVLRDLLLEVPGKVIVLLSACGSGAAVYESNGIQSGNQPIDRAAAFNARVVEAFRSADPGVMESDYASNTGELRRVNKFYVLTAAAYKEESWGYEESRTNSFVQHLTKGVGKSGSMPADTKYAGNKNGMVDLHELYRYISATGDYVLNTDDKKKEKFYVQHVQVYPSGVRYALFK